LLTFHLASHAWAQIPSTNEGYSMDDYQRQHVAFRARQMIAPYKTHSKDTGEARNKAVKFFEAYIHQVVAGPVKKRKLLKMADAAIKAGSNDPQLRAYRLHLLGNRLEQQQYEACFDAKYFKDARDAKDEKERNELLLKTWEQMIKMISAKDDTDHRFYWHVIEDLFAKPNLFFFDKKDKTPLFLDALAGEEELDPWLRFMLLGNCYGKMSYSLSDSEQTQCLAQMRNCFEQAHELHPEYPEAAVELIENMV